MSHDTHVNIINRIFNKHIADGTPRYSAISICTTILSDHTNRDIADGWRYGMVHGMDEQVLNADSCLTIMSIR
jgi:hypothetical protein